MDSATLIEAYERARKSSPAAASEDRYRDQWRWDKATRAIRIDIEKATSLP